MFERYSDSARLAVVTAQEAARRLNHNYIGTEHLLAALVKNAGRPAMALNYFNITSEYVRVKTIEIIGMGQSEIGGHIPFTPSARAALVLALQEADEVKDEAITDSHLLLGLLGLETGVGLEIVKSLVPNISEVREVLLKDMSITRKENLRAIDAIEIGTRIHMLLEEFVVAGGALDAIDFTRGQADAAQQIIDLLKGDGGSADFTLSA